MTLVFASHSPCPRCAAPLHPNVRRIGERAPVPGDVGICRCCLTVFVFELRDRVRLITASETEAMSSELRASLAEARRVIAFEQIRARLRGNGVWN